MGKYTPLGYPRAGPWLKGSHRGLVPAGSSPKAGVGSAPPCPQVATGTPTHPTSPAPAQPHLSEVHILRGGQPEAPLGALVGQ